MGLVALPLLTFAIAAGRKGGAALAHRNIADAFETKGLASLAVAEERPVRLAFAGQFAVDLELLP